MFKLCIGIKDNGEPILSDEIQLTEEDIFQIKQHQRDEMYARLERGEATRQELQREVSFFNGKFQDVCILEPNGKVYFAEDLQKK